MLMTSIDLKNSQMMKSLRMRLYSNLCKARALKKRSKMRSHSTWLKDMTASQFTSTRTTHMNGDFAKSWANRLDQSSSKWLSMLSSNLEELPSKTKIVLKTKVQLKSKTTSLEQTIALQ
jgi:hypothetical protein